MGRLAAKILKKMGMESEEDKKYTKDTKYMKASERICYTYPPSEAYYLISYSNENVHPKSHKTKTSQNNVQSRKNTKDKTECRCCSC